MGPLETLKLWLLLTRQKRREIIHQLPLDLACIIGCAVQTGVGAALNTAKVEAGATVLVMGAGGIGLSIVQGARIAGATRIDLVEAAYTQPAEGDEVAGQRRYSAIENIILSHLELLGPMTVAAIAARLGFAETARLDGRRAYELALV